MSKTYEKGAKMENRELKLCPFCGGEAVIRTHTEMVGFGMSDTLYFVKCTACRMRGSAFGRLDGDNKSEIINKAVTAWNRRANDGT